MPESGSTRRSLRFTVAFATAIIALYATPLCADKARVAVAANFTQAAQEIGALFAQKTPHRAVFSFGSTGTLYTQISQGAPFEVFLAADEERPKMAIAAGYAVTGSRFTYATGKIALYSADRRRITGADTLKNGDFAKIAIANPVTAPYGVAAVQTMKALGVYDALSTKLVQGKNIAQAYQFVDTANAEFGFVAVSQIARHAHGARWIVPEHLYTPIRQDAVLLNGGAGNDAAKAFLAFLRGPGAEAVKKKFGYGIGD